MHIDRYNDILESSYLWNRKLNLQKKRKEKKKKIIIIKANRHSGIELEIFFYRFLSSTSNDWNVPSRLENNNSRKTLKFTRLFQQCKSQSAKSHSLKVYYAASTFSLSLSVYSWSERRPCRKFHGLSYSHPVEIDSSSIQIYILLRLE